MPDDATKRMATHGSRLQPILIARNEYLTEMFLKSNILKNFKSRNDSNFPDNFFHIIAHFQVYRYLLHQQQSETRIKLSELSSQPPRSLPGTPSSRMRAYSTYDDEPEERFSQSSVSSRDDEHFCKSLFNSILQNTTTFIFPCGCVDLFESQK